MLKPILSGLIALLCCTQSLAQPDAGEMKARLQLLQHPALRPAHVGIYIYDDSVNRTVAAYQDEKYFTPASNTKLFSLYTGLRLLGDSLPGINYIETDTAVFLVPTGDPTLLDSLYAGQPVVDFLQSIQKKIYFVNAGWKEDGLGKGWSTDDYDEGFSAERSPLPLNGNTVLWKSNGDNHAVPEAYPANDWNMIQVPVLQQTAAVVRSRYENTFSIATGKPFDNAVVPFITDTIRTAVQILRHLLHKEIGMVGQAPAGVSARTIFSRPVDSMYIPMMFESINLDAEQILLMSSFKLFGVMSDEQMINWLLQHDLADLPQKPVWADGSGNSRYNLFSPRDMVMVLDKMKKSFGMDRMKRLLPTGGQGTLSKYYQQDSGHIFAKTGSMSGVICLSGYFYSRKGHLLYFSVMINHSNGSGAAIRKAVELYLETVAKEH